MNVDCRWPGSLCKFLIPGVEKIPNYLIGYPGYPLTLFCMKENELLQVKNAQTVFNHILRNALNPIECAYMED